MRIAIISFNHAYLQSVVCGGLTTHNQQNSDTKKCYRFFNDRLYVYTELSEKIKPTDNQPNLYQEAYYRFFNDLLKKVPAKTGKECTVFQTLEKPLKKIIAITISTNSLLFKKTLDEKLKSLEHTNQRMQRLFNFFSKKVR